MQIVASPSQSFKHWSMWLGIAIGVFPALIVLIENLGKIEVLSPTAMLAIVSFLGFLIVPAKLIKQYLEVTNDQQRAMAEDVAALPMKPGEVRSFISVNGEVLPTHPVK